MPKTQFSWMWGDPAKVLERKEEEIEPLLKKGLERERKNNQRRIRMLVKMDKARKLKVQR